MERGRGDLTWLLTVKYCNRIIWEEDRLSNRKGAPPGLRFLLVLTLAVYAVSALAQANTSTAPANSSSTGSPPSQSQPAAAPSSSSPANLPNAPAPTPEKGSPADRYNKDVPLSEQQPKRILGIMPNYRAVSAGAQRTPPTAKESFGIATYNSFDYSAFVFTALTSLIAKGEDAHPQLGKGVPGLWAYTWRGFVDKTDGNYLVLFALPTLFREDERYFALGQGSIWKRTVYSLRSVVITPNYAGNNTFNIAELLGRGIAESVSTAYYPAADRNASEVLTKYGYAVMRDALTNSFREFWPDIAVHVLHRHP